MFGRLTAYSRAPEGFWDSGNTVKRDDILVVEVMVDSLDRTWWKDYRRELENLFHQDQIVFRAQYRRAAGYVDRIVAPAVVESQASGRVWL
jgi:hypothetical protein